MSSPVATTAFGPSAHRRGRCATRRFRSNVRARHARNLVGDLQVCSPEVAWFTGELSVVERLGSRTFGHLDSGRDRMITVEFAEPARSVSASGFRWQGEESRFTSLKRVTAIASTETARRPKRLLRKDPLPYLLILTESCRSRLSVRISKGAVSASDQKQNIRKLYPPSRRRATNLRCSGNVTRDSIFR